MGILTQPMADPYTQTQTLSLVPVSKEVIAPDFMEKMEFSFWDQFAWEDLTERDNAVLLSDNKEFTNHVDVAPAVDLPRWQLETVPAYAPWSRPEDQWGRAPQQDLAPAPPVYSGAPGQNGDQVVQA